MARLRLLALLVPGAILVPLACGSPPRPVTPAPERATSPADVAMWSEAQSVFENRCVVCHGCYDAPCQLKLGTFDGIARGASRDKVYDSKRLVAATPTRLDIDAHDVDGWRKKGFHPVLPEGSSDPRASLLLRMLDLKRTYPLPATGELDKLFTLGLDRKETCTTAEHFEDYARSHPLWGMPYALPGLDEAQDRMLVRWISAGAPHPATEPLPGVVSASIAEWEAFLDEPSPKSQLVGRYIYEHLFLASLYFAEMDEGTFFRLVRSRTPRGVEVDEIPTRRPFDDPKVPRVYYRFVRRPERPLEKTHMPYALSAARLRHWKELFLGVHIHPGQNSLS